ncbi:CobW family GTP-binding protein [Dorea formicigenerans]|uniref:CobW family GTP-binding protein n=3 Tax=Dorea formicigenerans TaxID=39486 RepID=UPI000E4AFFCD|nr:CobW family GTP-binding protein [Dorea formicigenerans]RHC18800.1 GTP-binding protein [Dorea formicigenerans]
MTKVDIISGFLGAGKTTFIKELIEKVFAGEKLVLIENEFGEIGIDGGFLQDAGIEITEMNSGCICCTLVGDFSVALKKVLDEYHPDHVIIEPSGVGKLSDVAAAIENVKEDADIEIEGRITVVDGKKAKMYLDNFGEFFENQVEYASTIVISRTQNMTDEKIEACVHLLREKNDKATIISTPWDQLSGDAIRHALEHGAEIEGLFEHHHDHDEECGCGHHHHDHDEECGCGHHHHDHDEECGCGHHHHDHDEECGCGHHHHDHDEECGCGHHHHDHHDHDEECSCGCGHHHDHHHHHADEVFTSWGKETAHKYTEEELDYLLKALSETDAYGTILRSKGIIQMADGNWKQFDLVPQEYEVRDGQADYAGRMVVIGTDLKEDELAKLFHVQ